MEHLTVLGNSPSPNSIISRTDADDKCWTENDCWCPIVPEDKIYLTRVDGCCQTKAEFWNPTRAVMNARQWAEVRSPPQRLWMQKLNFNQNMLKKLIKKNNNNQCPLYGRLPALYGRPGCPYPISIPVAVLWELYLPSLKINARYMGGYKRYMGGQGVLTRSQARWLEDYGSSNSRHSKTVRCPHNEALVHCPLYVLSKGVSC